MGQEVVIDGLLNWSDLNGKQGVITTAADDSDRVCVDICDLDHWVRLHVSKLKRASHDLGGSCSAAAPP